MSMTQISLDETTLARLDATAKLLSLSREDALREAVEYLEAWGRDFRKDVEAGIASAERGELYSAEEVEQEFSVLRASYATVNCR